MKDNFIEIQKNEILIGFDVDGVMLDTLHDSYSTDCKLIKKYGGIPPSLDVYRSSLKTTDWKRFYSSFSVDKNNIDVLCDEYYKILPKYPSSIPGVKDTIESLLNNGCDLFVVSKCADLNVLMERLRYAKLAEYFDRSRIYAVTTTKRDTIASEIEKSGIKPCFFLGDTVKDIVEANEAGAKSIAVINEFSYGLEKDVLDAKPNFVLSSISELGAALKIRSVLPF